MDAHSPHSSCSLIKLPKNVIVSIFEQFLTLHSIARLDSALCSRFLRPTHLANLTRACISNFAAFKLNVMLTETKFDAVLCIRWLMDKGISPHALVIPRLRTQSPLAHPHFSRPDLLQSLTTLHIRDMEGEYIGWWEDLIIQSPNVRELMVCGRGMTTFQCLETVANHCHKLEVLHIVNTGDALAFGDDELQIVLSYYKRLNDRKKLQVCFNECLISVHSFGVLKASNIAFLVCCNEWNAFPYTEMIDNQANIGRACMLWRDVSQDRVEKYFQESLRTNRIGDESIFISNLQPCYNVITLVCAARTAAKKPKMRLTMRDCDSWTAHQFTSLMQLPFIERLHFSGPCPLSELVCPSVVYDNTTTRLLSLHGFTNLTAHSVTRIATCHSKAAIHLRYMPQIENEVLPASVRVYHKY